MLCKATAVQVLAGTEASDDMKSGLSNRLIGVVERVSPGVGQDEVVIALPGGGHWVGFAEHPFAASPGSPAMAHMAPAALVLALPR